MSKYYKAQDVDYAIRMKYAEEKSEEREEVISEICRLISELPTIEVSEDCIDRKKLLEQIDKDSEGSPGYYGDTWQFIKTIENAPSVVPTTEQSSKVGEWLPIVEATEMGEPYIAGIYCSACGETLGHEANFCPSCGTKMKG